MNHSQKSVLITGSAGLLGSKFTSLYRNSGYFVGAVYRTKEPENYDIKYQIDLSNKNDLLKIEDHFQLIINCAGFTDVNENEKLPEKSWLENVVASNNVSEFARKNKSKFVQVSTDHFSSIQNLVRDEKIIMNPVNQYGYAKLEAEKIITKNNSDSLIIRTNFFGKKTTNNNSLLAWILNKIEKEEDILGYDDILFNPVSIDYLFDAINILIKNSAIGTYNVGSKEAISKYNFIKLVMDSLGIEHNKLICSLSPVDPDSAKRPKFMALDCSKFERATGMRAPDISELLRSELMIN